MLRLDHFVIHIDHDLDKLNQLKQEFDQLNLPFDPSRGKGTKGFKVANLWVGEQYLEMPYLKRLDGGGWKPEWVENYNQGKRGIFGLCLFTNSLDEIKEGLVARGVELEGPERITFSMMFGLLKKSLPFRTVYTKPLPGTDLQFFFLQMDSDEKYEFMKKFMKPNARDVGVTAINEAVVKKKFTTADRAFIQKVFPELTVNEGEMTLDMGETQLHFKDTEDRELRVDLHVRAEREEQQNKKLDIENVTLYFK